MTVENSTEGEWVTFLNKLKAENNKAWFTINPVQSIIIIFAPSYQLKLSILNNTAKRRRTILFNGDLGAHQATVHQTQLVIKIT